MHVDDENKYASNGLKLFDSGKDGGMRLLRLMEDVFLGHYLCCSRAAQ